MHIKSFQHWLTALLLPVFLLIGGCGSNGDEQATAHGPMITVYKSPSCNCCGLWVEHLESHGFNVDVVAKANVMPIKKKLGVPAGMGSCHTAIVDGYVIEGHVPAQDIQRLLKERPTGSGLAVPGMPVGSPGMEMGDRHDPYHVYLFSDKDDKPIVFSSHHQSE